MRGRSMILGLALGIAVGCRADRGAATPGPVSPPPVATCERLADHLVGLIQAELERQGSPGAEDSAARQRPALLRACVDAGDPASTRCLQAATSMKQARACRGAATGTNSPGADG